MKTEFASPERASDDKLKSDIQHTKKLPLVKELTHIIPDAFVIINQQRQIIYCNTTLIQLLGLETSENVYGLRLGEALGCIHSNKTDGGCGTTKFCRHCGAVNAMIKSQLEPDNLKEEQCRLTSGDDHQSSEFKIRANTLNLSGELFTIVIAKDNSNEKRRDALERIFFHDILNTAGGVQGLIELMEDASEDEMDEYLKLAASSSETLVEEIHAQREILAAENGKLEIEFSQLNTIEIIQSVIAVYKRHPVADNKIIKMSENSVSTSFISDPRLMIRVLGNMMKNGLEAESQGQTLTIGANMKEEKIEFWVHNSKVMPEEIKLQVFQRSFSTKGAGRGLGTYSIKLLGERYLKGKVTFVSKLDKGTIFSIHLPMGLESSLK